MSTTATTKPATALGGRLARDHHRAPPSPSSRPRILPFVGGVNLPGGILAESNPVSTGIVAVGGFVDAAAPWKSAPPRHACCERATEERSCTANATSDAIISASMKHMPTVAARDWLASRPSVARFGTPTFLIRADRHRRDLIVITLPITVLSLLC
jgi:hypothetical protein